MVEQYVEFVGQEEEVYKPKTSSKWTVNFSLVLFCCRKTAVCNGNQLLDYSVPELVLSQSMLSTDPEVLQNCSDLCRFTLCSSLV